MIRYFYVLRNDHHNKLTSELFTFVLMTRKWVFMRILPNFRHKNSEGQGSL